MKRSFSRRAILRWGAAAAALIGDRTARSDASTKNVYLQPLGDGLSDEEVVSVQRALVSFFAVRVPLLTRVPLPKASYYPPRNRYRAEKLLEFLDPRLPSDGFRILGLTSSDISTTKGDYEDWGILGLATLDGRACVISSTRCKRNTKSPAQATVRFAKVAVHEIGHTLGLEHCPTRGCLMEDAEGKVATCDREYDLCSSCRERLLQRGHALDRPAEIPWARPDR